MHETAIIRSNEIETTHHEWGYISFFASGSVGPARDQSVGRCVIYAGKALPRHYHPDCSEIIHVLQGRIIHTASPDGNVELSPGDTIVVPVGFVHKALNAGDGAAVLFITFSSANRQFIVVPE